MKASHKRTRHAPFFWTATNIIQVILGLDFLGNPVQFFQHVSTGVTALYYEPFLEGLQSMASHTLRKLFYNISKHLILRSWCYWYGYEYYQFPWKWFRCTEYGPTLSEIQKARSCQTENNCVKNITWWPIVTSRSLRRNNGNSTATFPGRTGGFLILSDELTLPGWGNYWVCERRRQRVTGAHSQTGCWCGGHDYFYCWRHSANGRGKRQY